MSTRLQGPKAVADVSVGTLFASVEIGASPERVFDALASEEVAAWWGDETEYKTTSWTGDVRVGGTWRSDGRGADGTAFSVHGEFIEVDRPRKLVQTWNPSWDPGNSTKLTYQLEAIEGGTRLTLRHEGFRQDQRESCRGHSMGWQRVFGWLARYLNQAPAANKFYLFRLVPPRPTFPFDMSARERKVMDEHGQYWRSQLAEGRAIVFGPVADPAGAWGLATIQVATEAEMQAVRDGDPAFTGDIGMRYEVVPMISAVARA